MSNQSYLEDLLAKYGLTEGQVSNLKARRAQIENLLRARYGSHIETFYYSGSYAKGTAINLAFDLDLCPYFKRNSFATLKELYTSVFDVLRTSGYSAEKQTVAIRVNLGGNDVDVVPARSLEDGKGNANLYVTTRDSWLQTNIPVHKEYISNSGARAAIKLMKIWKFRRGIHFKSFGLELLVIKALEKMPSGSTLDNQFLAALEFARDNATDAKLVDPANSANIVSDDIPLADKQNLQRQAAASRALGTWAELIW